ncbi:MAG: Type II secretion system F domain protein [Candidatus Kaiserbacteria bacterium GW2011_GWC2_52_8b]|uniref:Type II secretion system F domain protein n=1 Tax=Candidatus Kaiserbacteria bacterium GW2011_GWC2_52_8b TaxID=1618676 RepID=A0A0G1XH25_9BACT|nr:MAG: Type II secretion system F domain protein [Candidatus Kaiserbacteria bacterium GW2011_GWC2_52_8b]
MARFSYTAEKTGGDVYKGIAEARDRFELYDVVRREGGKLIALSEESHNKKWSLRYWNAKLTTVKEYDKVLFARNLGAMLGAGLSLARALSVLERQTKNPHVALAKFPNMFSRIFVAMVRSGEEGGDLSGSLGTMADQMERMYQLKKKIRSALIYPAVVIVAIVGIGALMMVNVVPTLAQTFEEMNAELPASTKLIIAISNFLVEYTILSLGLTVALGILVYMALRTSLGRIGPMVREVNAARTSRTLASLLSSGVDVLASLEITGDVVQNSYFKEVIEDARRGVAQGEPLSTMFVRREDLYPSFVGEMMAVGEETGETTEMLKRLAIFYEEEVDRKTKDLSTIIEPFLMLFIGSAVGFFAISMITPIYSLSQNIG